MAKRQFILTARYTERVVYLESPEQLAAIDKLAAEHGRSRSEIIRALIAAGISEDDTRGD